MKSRNKIIKELKRASGKSYKECRDFLKSISWDLEGNNLAYWSFIMSVYPELKEKALSFDLNAIADKIVEIGQAIAETARTATEALFEAIEQIPPATLEFLRKEAVNEQRDDQVSEP